MKTKSKFNERRGLDKFSPREVKSVLTFLAQLEDGNINPLELPGEKIDATRIYDGHYGMMRVWEEWGAKGQLEPETDPTDTPFTVDCLDAALRFLVKYGFIIDTSKTRWVVRKPFTIDDVDEACAVAAVSGAPRLDHETAFDTLRRVRGERENARA